MTWVTTPFRRNGVTAPAMRFWPPAASGGRTPITPQPGWAGTRRTYPNGWTVDRFPTLADDPLSFVPPPVWPNTDDGLPITQLGVSFWKDYTGERPLKNYSKIWSLTNSSGTTGIWDTSVSVRNAKISAGDFNPFTGWMTLAIGETVVFRTPRKIQEDGYPELDAGKWVLKIEISAGSSIAMNPASGAAWVNEGSTSTTIRKTRTLSAANTSADAITITGGVAGGQFRWIFAGLETDENTWEDDPFQDHFKTYCEGYKVLRFLDWWEIANNRAAHSDDLIQSGSWIWQGIGAAWTARLSGRVTGFSHDVLAKLCADVGRSLWINIPSGIGLHITQGVANGFYTSSANTNTEAARGLYQAALDPLMPAIFAEALVQYRIIAGRYIQDLIDAGYPNSTYWYVEIGNENWNSGIFTQGYNLARAVEYHLLNRATNPLLGTSGWAGIGYLAAIMGRAFQEKIDELKPGQLVKFVIGAQTGSGTSGDRRMIDAWELYQADVGASALPTSQLAIATTGYHSHAFKWQQSQSTGNGNPWGAADETAFVNAFIASATISEDNLFREIRDWHIDPTKTKAPSVYGSLADNHLHRDYIRGRGAEWLGQYEGSLHEDESTAGQLVTTYGSAAWNARRNNWLRSHYGHQVQSLLIYELYAADPEAIISNYQEVYQIGNWASWQEKEPDQVNTYLPNTNAASWDDVKVGTAYFYTPMTLNHAAGTEAGYPFLLDATMFSTGSAHGFFTNSQTDGGDIRAYSDNTLTTRLPIELVEFDKATGHILAWVRSNSALAQNATIILRTGGNAGQILPVYGEPFGPDEVWAGWEYITHDMATNSVDGTSLTLTGGAASAGQGNLNARTYNGLTDSSDIANVAVAATGTLFAQTFRTGNGGSGFGRMRHSPNGPDFHYNSSRYTIELEDGTATDPEFYIASPALSTWFDHAVSWSNETTPIFYENGVSQSVTVVQAFVGTFQPVTETIALGNHDPALHNRGWAGRLCETWETSLVKSAAFCAARSAMLSAPSTFMTAGTGGASP